MFRYNLYILERLSERILPLLVHPLNGCNGWAQVKMEQDGVKMVSPCGKQEPKHSGHGPLFLGT